MSKKKYSLKMAEKIKMSEKTKLLINSAFNKQKNTQQESIKQFQNQMKKKKIKKKL
jgi:hypothetical protein